KRLPFASRPSASRSQKRRSPTTPACVSSISSGWTRWSDFTGAIEIRATWPAIPRSYLRGRLVHVDDLSAAPQPARVDLEDPEVAARDMDGDVVDGDIADPPFERARVCVAMEDKIGAVLGDRRREAVAAEKCADSCRLALERVGDR